MKRIIKLMVLLFAFSFITVYASGDVWSDTIEQDEKIYTIDINGNDRKNVENYGVKKHWEINSDNLDNVLKTPLVDSNLKIYDYAYILNDEDEKELFTIIGNYIEHTNMDMVVLTINMPYYSDSENEEVAADFYDYNDFGLNVKNNSGVLLLRNVYKQDPYFNVYTFGDAQLYYDYDRCESMLDLIYPYFVSKDYLNGLKLFIDTFNDYYDNGFALKNHYVDENGYVRKYYTIPYLASSIIGIIVSIIIILIMISKNKMIKKAKYANDYIDKKSIKYNVKSDRLTGSFTTRHRITSDSSSSGGGGGFSHSGSSGGGHGFGGGRHG